MPENTKPKDDTCRAVEKEVEKKLVEAEDEDTAARGCERRENSYYYDDAHGYEIYKPDEDEDD